MPRRSPPVRSQCSDNPGDLGGSSPLAPRIAESMTGAARSIRRDGKPEEAPLAGKSLEFMGSGILQDEVGAF